MNQCFLFKKVYFYKQYSFTYKGGTDMEKRSFLEYLAQEAGCDCLSDLRLRQEQWSPRIIEILGNIDMDEYVFSDWKEVTSYLTDTELSVLDGIKTKKEAKEYIINWLNSKKH